jgi:acyl-CoA hydrolase
MKIPIVYKSAEEALAVVKPGDRVYLHGSAQTPTLLLKALAGHSSRLKDVELVFISVYGDKQVDKPEYEGIFNINSMFVSASIRKDVNEGRLPTKKPWICLTSQDSKRRWKNSGK